MDLIELVFKINIRYNIIIVTVETPQVEVFRRLIKMYIDKTPVFTNPILEFINDLINLL